MRIEPGLDVNPKMHAALEGLAGMIADRYPHAQFQVSRHPDESGTVLLDTIVDVDDTESANDLIFERMEQLRLDEGVTILVIPLRTPQRVAKLVNEQRIGIPAALA